MGLHAIRPQGHGETTMSGDQEPVAYFNENTGDGYCAEHMPKGVELCPIYKSDTWAGDVGICTDDDCDTWIGDLAS